MSTDIRNPYYRPEVWGRIECTINRVRDEFRDQLQESGHYDRNGDIENIAALHISKLRYPILWERHQPVEGGSINWDWITTQLETLRQHRIDPIAGLLHHGSGPAYTNLIDPDFPNKLSHYAAQVAEQFPWITYYTPVNEPLTTARFSGLYGLWYPHHRSERDFFQMLLHQLKAVVLSMQAIRKINASAQLVQTEDLGKTYSSPILKYQSNFENERRWLTNDFLSGKVDRQHYFWKYLLRLGIEEKDLAYFQEHICTPDIIGYNYYVTSERYLDHRLHDYPSHLHGGNGRHVYVDTEAVRKNQQDGLPAMLKESWHRYRLPLAITECHLNCTREQQLRWFKETWDHCCRLKKEDVDIKAVTAWSLLGAYDWNSLLTERNKHYESGVFSIQENGLRPTAMGKMIRHLSTSGHYQHPALEGKGWWNDPAERAFEVKPQIVRRMKKPVLILGSHGTLGAAFCRICKERDLLYYGLSHAETNILDPKAVLAAIDKHKPWAIINAAGYVRVDDAELNPDVCFALNTYAPAFIAQLCEQKGIQFMTFSSDLVFNGIKEIPYVESDQVEPLNVYGASKAKAEKLIADANPGALIIRSSAFFGPWDQYNFAHNVLQTLKNQNTCDVPDDLVVSPTYVPDLVNVSLDLLIDEEKSIWHLATDGCLSWKEFARDVAARAGYNSRLLNSKSSHEMNWRAKRPIYSVLQSGKGIKLPSIEKALDRYFTEKVY